ncbi:aldehyde dehydrogenase [Streptosporangium violaceochromogenes]|nr:aldehyde dehydrogenase [Streptosporangium violaceochromogenes]
MTRVVKRGHSWDEAFASARALAPEAFTETGALNHWGGAWRDEGRHATAVSPLDGRPIPGPAALTLDQGRAAVRSALDGHRNWRRLPLAERRARVRAAVEAMAEHRDLLTLLLVWEIGKTWPQAAADVDRCLSGVRWYVEEIEGMLGSRASLEGPVSNIASWNYPMSVLMHGMLVQALAGNGVIAKVPSDGGLCCLTLATALAVREGLPFTLVSGSGPELAPALVAQEGIGCVAFVGGREAGRRVRRLLRPGTRHILELEGLNCWGVWEFSDWETLSAQIRKGYEYAKQRCTAYPRFVVQRGLFDRFLAAHRPVLESLRFGHPLAVEHPGDDLPELDFGPLINAAKAAELRGKVDDAIGAGAVPLYRGGLSQGRFLPGQDVSAYLPPSSLLHPPPSSPLHHAEPFGPVDSVVLVDSEEELVHAMNVSNGSLVAAVSCDDERTAARVAGHVRAFKVGINAPRSRGDRHEVFGGEGASWLGAFVGGELLVRAVTQGADDGTMPGNFPAPRHRLPV